MKTIRLRKPIRVGKEIFPNNAVFDAADDVADELLDCDPPCAEETDAIERYPIGNPLHHVDDYPVTGAEKFPLREPRKGGADVGVHVNDADRHVEDNIRAAAPGPAATTSKEPDPARIEVTKADEKRARDEEAAAAEARAATAVPVVLVDDPKKGKP